MNLVKWQFRDLEISMVKIVGELYCTSTSLCSALGMTTGQLRNIVYTSKGRLVPMSVTNRDEHQDLLLFLITNGTKLGINKRQPHATLKLWSLNQALKIAYRARTDVAEEFIEASIELVKAEATEGYISRDEFKALEERYDRLEQIILNSKTSLELAATAAGRSLQASRATKQFREN